MVGDKASPHKARSIGWQQAVGHGRAINLGDLPSDELRQHFARRLRTGWVVDLTTRRPQLWHRQTISFTKALRSGFGTALDMPCCADLSDADVFPHPYLVRFQCACPPWKAAARKGSVWRLRRTVKGDVARGRPGASVGCDSSRSSAQTILSSDEEFLEEFWRALRDDGC